MSATAAGRKRKNLIEGYLFIGPWLLGFLLAMNFWTLVLAMVACDDIFSGNMEVIMMMMVGSALVWLVMIGWFCMGLRLFDRGMAGEDARMWPIHVRF